MPEWLYRGYEQRGYLSYVDLATDSTLIADPGEAYDMRGVDPSDSVPPPDGFWVANVQELPAPSKAAVSRVTPAAPATTESDGE